MEIPGAAISLSALSEAEQVLVAEKQRPVSLDEIFDFFAKQRAEHEARIRAQALLDRDVPPDVQACLRILADLYLHEDYLSRTKYNGAELLETQQLISRAQDLFEVWRLEGLARQLADWQGDERAKGNERPEGDERPKRGRPPKAVLEQTAPPPLPVSIAQEPQSKSRIRQRAASRGLGTSDLIGWGRVRPAPTLSYYDNRRDPRQFDRYRFGIYAGQYEGS